MKMNFRFTVLMVVGLMALAGCQVLCDPHSRLWEQTCSYELMLNMQELQKINGQDQLVDVTRLDVRNVDQDLRILVTAVSKGKTDPIPLSGEPFVEKMVTDVFLPLQVVLDPAEEVKRSLLVRQNDQAEGVVLREPGPFEFRVTLTVSTALEMLSAKGMVMMFQSPRFRQPQEIIYTNNPFNSVRVLGRMNVQVVNPFGDNKLMVTERYEQGLELRSWVELYEPDSTGKIVYSNSTKWDSIRLKIVGNKNAELVLVNGALAIYQTDIDTRRLDLALVRTMNTDTWSGLSKVESAIPSDATQLAGCAEDSLVAMVKPETVLFFQTNLDPFNTKKVLYLDKLSFPGTQKPVIATSYISANTKASKKYYAVIAHGMGFLTLVTRDLNQHPLSDTVTLGLTKDRPVTALALADLDSDGLQDIILAMKDGTLWWSPQQPNGTFKLAESLGITVPLERGAFPTRLSVGDVLGDASPDLAVATSENRVFVYKNE